MTQTHSKADELVAPLALERVDCQVAFLPPTFTVRPNGLRSIFDSARQRFEYESLRLNKPPILVQNRLSARMTNRSNRERWWCHLREDLSVEGLVTSRLSLASLSLSLSRSLSPPAQSSPRQGAGGACPPAV